MEEIEPDASDKEKELFSKKIIIREIRGFL